MVPYLKSVISTMLPLLCLVKQGDMKWIFAYGKQLIFHLKFPIIIKIWHSEIKINNYI